MCRANRNRQALRQQQMNRRRRSPPVSVAVLKDLAGRDTSLSRPLSPGHLLQPSLHGRPRSHPFEFGAQKLLHGLTLRSSTSGELVTHFLGDIADSDLNSHDCILPAVRSYCNHELEARTGLRSFARSALSSWHRPSQRISREIVTAHASRGWRGGSPHCRFLLELPTAQVVARMWPLQPGEPILSAAYGIFINLIRYTVK